MYTATDIVEKLLKDPTERGLSEMSPRPPYCTIPSSLGNLSAIGYVAIEVHEGLLLIPYNQVRLGQGWEQLVLEQRVIVPTPIDWHVKRQAFEESVRVLESTLPSMNAFPVSIDNFRATPGSDIITNPLTNIYRKPPIFESRDHSKVSETTRHLAR